MCRHQTTACRGRKDAGKVIAGKNDIDKTLPTEKSQEQEQLTIKKPEKDQKQFTPKVEDSDIESSSDDESYSESLPDDPEKLKALCRQLYKELHDNIKCYHKLILLLGRLWRMGCLTHEEYIDMNKNLQKKIGML